MGLFDKENVAGGLLWDLHIGFLFLYPIKIDKPIFLVVVVGLFAHHLVSTGMPEVISYLNLNLIELDSWVWSTLF